MKPTKIRNHDYIATINKINTWARLAHNYVTSPSQSTLALLLNPNYPMQRQFILRNLKQQYTEMAHLLSKLCKLCN